jgi:hypothetical protein
MPPRTIQKRCFKFSTNRNGNLFTFRKQFLLKTTYLPHAADELSFESRIAPKNGYVQPTLRED